MKQFSLVVVFILAAGLAGCTGGKSSAAAPNAQGVTVRKAAATELNQTDICVVCGMKTYVSEGVNVAEYKGKTYSFCSVGDEKLFAADPEKYLTNAAKAVHHGGMDHSGHNH